MPHFRTTAPLCDFVQVVRPSLPPPFLHLEESEEQEAAESCRVHATNDAEQGWSILQAVRGAADPCDLNSATGQSFAVVNTITSLTGCEL